MEPLEAATASGDAINGLGTKFMLDMNTYVYGGGLGYEGADFYVAGRGGALGDVPAGVVAAAFVFFNPDYVAESWDRSAGVMPRAQAAAEFAGVAHRWAEEHIGDTSTPPAWPSWPDASSDAASPACAPLFAGWRALAEPDADRPKALALHRINGLRELRGALHGAAVLAQGMTPHAAVARRTPYMLAGVRLAGAPPRQGRGPRPVGRGPGRHRASRLHHLRTDGPGRAGRVRGAGQRPAGFAERRLSRPPAGNQLDDDPDPGPEPRRPG